jgi:hypothetical protein
LQTNVETRPPAILVEGEEEYPVEKILRKEWVKKGRVKKWRLCYLVKWTGYAKPTHEPVENLVDTTATHEFEE